MIKDSPLMDTNSRSKMGVEIFLEDQGMITQRPTSEAANAQNVAGVIVIDDCGENGRQGKVGPTSLSSPY